MTQTSQSRMSETDSKALVYKPPARPTLNRPSVILYGSIEPDPANDWQTSLARSLVDLPVTVINPRCDAWDSTWVEDASDLRFKEQVEWEMDYAKLADVIAFYFKPGTLTPITLLELGMYAGTGKAVVCCPKGFYKRGNVQIVCARYGIELLETLEELESAIRKRMTDKLAT
ncbi:uncharacterized protein EKO05_0006371 [Ascochyta rabiei]|uniref:uncharacterized protein n=1 Tax=Didymella rabiei TaxID=5454 RepID=UPI00220F2A39|nr:uncharacterized protein EKO05_0006371 [Ascochyta rabiei]UPX15941.1 hypothetical protein EKO05_0006371 [Ascochyta rabiei]